MDRGAWQAAVHGVAESIPTAPLLTWSILDAANAMVWKQSLLSEHLNFSEIRQCVLVAQLCLTLWDTMDCSEPGSSVHGILQAIILEWAANLCLQGIFPT